MDFPSFLCLISRMYFSSWVFVDLFFCFAFIHQIVAFIVVFFYFKHFHFYSFSPRNIRKMLVFCLCEEERDERENIMIIISFYVVYKIFHATAFTPPLKTYYFFIIFVYSLFFSLVVFMLSTFLFFFFFTCGSIILLWLISAKF